VTNKTKEAVLWICWLW